MGIERTFGSTLSAQVSVLTPSVPPRGDMLEQLRTSVHVQTFARWEHLVMVDSGYQGCAKTVNQLAAEAKAEWLFLIADDDLLRSNCLLEHYRNRGGADIVYSPPIVEGEPDAPFHGNPPGIPSTALIKTSLWRDLGGYDESLASCEDYDFFTRALEAGAVFHRLIEQTWIYRFGHGNKSRGATFGTA